MTPAFNVAFLLLSTIVAVEVRPDKDFRLKQKGATQHSGEELKDEALQDLCKGCKSLVTKVKEKMGDKASKAKIAKLVEEVCSKEKDEPVKAACQKIIEQVKDQLCEAVAKGDDPKTACKRVKLCKKKPPPYL
ncbi:antimicrobial peptide NK-lysin-like [Xyrichtys novacula]|uniref:Antimicrobial peptide NK-lysin-like n=1 Tax=Xyrichtys novacula TaxID=13765 RepID=A0AAV1GIP0_XYRNO|nr:antimicrobial peptide NK-lysin-like [Xyrichtys novacula]